MNIKFVYHKDIDFVKWDQCVKQSICTLPYALSFYLNTSTSNQWNALILDDYSAVMPLPYRVKLGVKYIFQPFFSQQLGIYSSILLSSEIQNLFIQSIPSDYKYIDCFLNYTQQLEYKSRCNLILDLKDSYEKISSNFSNNLKRNIQKSYKNNLIFQESEDVESYLAFAKQIMLVEDKDKYTEEVYTSLMKICTTCLQHKMASIIIIKHQEEILSALFLLKYRNRLINLVPLSSKKGKELYSSHYMHDSIIKKYAESNYLLDFEGSEIAGVKKYYMQFGAKEENYAHLKINRLPRLLRLIKK